MKMVTQMTGRAGARANLGTAPLPEPVLPAERRLELLGVMEQLRRAMLPSNRLATAAGFLLGGFVPLASYVVAHYEIDRVLPLRAQVAVLLVLGGLMYSARTVYEWGRRAFQKPTKALGFVVLLEGVMVWSHTRWLSFAALAYLVAINGIATGCNLALDKRRHSQSTVGRRDTVQVRGRKWT